ncbi:MAG TPA: DUF4198 domain-containing protein [Novosphingobium sp.]|nr:DUF4198 domain-containing protein [Novosphingobium sp.]
MKLYRIARFATVAGVLAASLATVSAEAHGIWFAQRAKQLALIYGIGADDLEMVKRLPQVEKIEAYDADYHPIKATARVSGPVVLIDSDAQPTVVAAVMPYGIWSRVGTGEFEKKTLKEMPNATVSTHNIKYAVAIVGPLSKPLAALPGQTVQIVPAGPIPTTLGTPLKYVVLYNGKPVAGAKVINDMVNDPDAKEVETGADGSVTLPVRNQGLNVIRAVYVGPTDQPELYRQVEHTATLAFTLAHAPE